MANQSSKFQKPNVRGARRRIAALTIGIAACLGASVGCLDLIGYRDHVVEPLAGGGGGGEQGGGSGGGENPCKPGSDVACYSGPSGTENVGICKGGLQTCAEDGSGFGTCKDQVLPEQETCRTTLDDDCNGADCVIWSRLEGDGVVTEVGDLEVDADGNVMVTGKFSGLANIGGTVIHGDTQGGSLFLAKFSPAGEPLWAKSFGGAETTYILGRSAVDKEGNVYLTGQFSGKLDFGGGPLIANAQDIFVAKLTNAGEYAWAFSYGDVGNEKVVDLAVGPLGDVFLFGEFDTTFYLAGNVLSPMSSVDLFVTKISPSGGVAWAKAYPGTDEQRASAIAIDHEGNPILTGNNNGTVNFGGVNIIDLSPGPQDIFLARLDGTDGSEIWSTGVGVESDYAYAASLALTLTSIYVGGEFAGSLNFGDSINAQGASDAFLVRLSLVDASHVWSKAFGGGSPDSISSISATPSGAIAITVTSSGGVTFGGELLLSAGANDMFVARFDDLGEHQWSRRFGGKGSEPFALCVLSPDDEVVVSSVIFGQDRLEIDFGNGPMTVANKTGAVIAKLGR